ncbi:glycosyltransferase [Stenomitos frigidus]
MPSYNASAFIAEAIESILNQTFQELELIIVDDGSIDDTVEIIQRHRYRDQRLRLIQIQHGGICQALNTGIKASKYGWIARMDADDIAVPTRLEKQMKAAIANPNVVVWGSYVHHLSLTGEVLSLQRQGPLTEHEFYSLKEAGEIPFVIHPTMFYKKDALLAVGGYDSQIALAQDLDLLSRLTEYGPILTVPEPLLLYRMHQKSSSMEKFFAQQFFSRYIVARHHARLNGTPLPVLDAFKQAEANTPFIAQFSQKVHLWGQFYYRKAGLHVAEKKYWRGGFYLSLAIATHPTYAIQRLWQQKFSPEARRALKQVSTSAGNSHPELDRSPQYAHLSRPQSLPNSRR